MADVIVTDPVDIRDWINNEDVILIDVREAQEYNHERIPVSQSIPLSTFDPAQVPVPTDTQKLVIHCQSGVRCGMAAQKLVAAGRTHPIYRMQGGIQGWKYIGGMTEK